MIDYNGFSDYELVRRLKSDDHAAFNEILRRYSTILINFTYRRISDLPLAEDLVCDVFADLWEKRDQQIILKGLEPFIFTTVRNRILDHHKRQKVTQRYIDNFRTFLSQEQNTTDHLVRYNDLSALIEKEIAALPEKMRQVFELNRKTEMSRKEMAEYLGIPENTVKTNLQRALRILRGRLGDSLMFILILHFC